MFQCWLYAAQVANLRYHIIETAFSNSENELALLAKHLSSRLLAGQLLKFKCDMAQKFTSPINRGKVNMTMQEISECVHGFTPAMLQYSLAFKL